MEYKYVLYTDTDVMFNYINHIQLLFVRILAMAPEFDKKLENPNSGVIIINIPAFRRYIDPLYSYVLENKDNLIYHDQWALANLFKDKWGRLSLKYNWKHYEGYNPAARIIHRHGPKPVHVEAILRGEPINKVYDMLFKRDQDSYKKYIEIARDIMTKACLPEDARGNGLKV